MRASLALLLAIVLAACGVPALAPTPPSTPGAPEQPSPEPTRPASERPTAAPPATATVAPTPAAAPQGPLRALGHGIATSAAFVPGAETVAVGTSAGMALLGLPDLRLIRFIPLASRLQGVVVSPGGQHIAASLDAPAGPPLVAVYSSEGVEQFVTAGSNPRFSPDAGLLAIDLPGAAPTTALLALPDGQSRGSFEGSAGGFSPDGATLVTYQQGRALLWNTADGRPLQTVTGVLTFDPAGGRAALADESGLVVYPFRGGSLDLGQPALRVTEPAADVTFSQSGDRIYAWVDRQLRAWSLPEGEEQPLAQLPIGELNELGPGGLMLAATYVGGDRPPILNLISLADGATIYESGGLSSSTPYFSPDGRQAAVITFDGLVTLIDLEQGQLAQRHMPGYTRVAAAADGALAGAQEGPLVDLYRPGSDDPARGGEGGQVFTGLHELSFPPDGAPVVEHEVFTYDGSIARAAATRWVGEGEPTTLWESAPEGSFEQELGWRAPWDYVALPGGQRAVWYSEAAGKVLVQSDGGAPEPLDHPAEQVVALALSPDGARLALASGEGAVRVLSLPDGVEQASFTLGEPAATLAFSADGGRLAAAGRWGALSVWGLADRATLLSATSWALDDPNATDKNPARGRAALSADGAMVAAAGASGLIVYRVGDGAELLSLEGQADDVVFAPGAVAVARQGQVQLWALP
jgi:WD40 repeat protein